MAAGSAEGINPFRRFERSKQQPKAATSPDSMHGPAVPAPAPTPKRARLEEPSIPTPVRTRLQRATMQRVSTVKVEQCASGQHGNHVAMQIETITTDVSIADLSGTPGDNIGMATSSDPLATHAAQAQHGASGSAGVLLVKAEPPSPDAAAVKAEDQDDQEAGDKDMVPVSPMPLVPAPVVVGMREKLGEPVQPLRMIIVGHNPSETTWRRGHAYAHPSNHMWRLLIRTGIAPPCIKGADDDDKMPGLAGVGFSDVGTGHPGTESAQFKSAVFVGWSQNFYERMRKHMAAASAAMGCTCGTCGAPTVVAFAGKRQYMELLNIGRRGAAKVKTVPLGLQPPDGPQAAGWPFPPSSEIWVCTSTSGAAVLTNEQREAPYRAVAERLAAVPWPRVDPPRCSTQ